MDKLGERIIKDTEEIRMKRLIADSYEADAKKLRREAAEMERLLEQARWER